MGVEESIGESSYQFCIQWIVYLATISFALKFPEAPTFDKSNTFGILRFASTISSIFSLSMGQFKVLLGQTFAHFSSFLQKPLTNNSFFLFLCPNISLCLFQAHSRTTEYSTSFVQKILYIFAAFGWYCTKLQIKEENFMKTKFKQRWFSYVDVI